jgi:hypothetical protein
LALRAQWATRGTHDISAPKPDLRRSFLHERARFSFTIPLARFAKKYESEYLRISVISEEFVFFDDGRHSHLSGRATPLDPDDATFAADADAFSEGDFRWQGKGEVDRSAGLNGRIDEEADTAGAYITGLCRVFLSIFAVADGDGQAEGETPGGALLFLLDFGHQTSEDCL